MSTHRQRADGSTTARRAINHATSASCAPGSGTQTNGGTAVGDFTVADLMPEALRQNLSRLVVGEVRGSEAAAMFEAMQAGTGTMSTTHSHSAASTLDRLASPPETAAPETALSEKRTEVEAR